MAAEIAIVVDEAALRVLLEAPPKDRRRLIKAVERTRDRLHEQTHQTHKEVGGRSIRVAVIERWMISHWYDGPVNELRIVDIQRVRS